MTENQVVIEDTDIDKRILLQAIEEKRRRIRENGIKYYVPQSQQEPFHKSKKRIRCVFGGNRSGKSVSGACEAVWYALGTHPHKLIPIPNYGRVVCTDFTNGIEKVILPEIKKWLPKGMLEKFDVDSRTMYLKNGSTIEFMSYDQDPEKFESASRHWIWFDEEPPQEIYKACQMRLLDTKGDLWLTMTPIKGLTWVYSDLYEQAGVNPNIEAFVYDTSDNPYIDKDTLDEISRGLSEAEREARLGGKFVQVSGLIYREYDPDIHNINRFPIPNHWPKICAIDPHPRNPTCVVYMAICPLSQFVQTLTRYGINMPPNIDTSNADVYTIYDEIYPQDPLLISDICRLMKEKEGQDYIQYRLIDSSSNTPDPIIGTTVREEFSKYNIRTILAEKDVSNRIFKVREKLQTNRLFFFNDLTNILWEIRHYAWDDYKIGRDYKDPKEKPRKKRDHAMDCLGYMISSCPRYDQPEVYRPLRPTINKYTGY